MIFCTKKICSRSKNIIQKPFRSINAYLSSREEIVQVCIRNAWYRNAAICRPE